VEEPPSATTRLATAGAARACAPGTSRSAANASAMISHTAAQPLVKVGAAGLSIGLIMLGLT